MELSSFCSIFYGIPVIRCVSRVAPFEKFTKPNGAIKLNIEVCANMSHLCVYPLNGVKAYSNLQKWQIPVKPYRKREEERICKNIKFYSRSHIFWYVAFPIIVRTSYKENIRFIWIRARFSPYSMALSYLGYFSANNLSSHRYFSMWPVAVEGIFRYLASSIIVQASYSEICRLMWAHVQLLVHSMGEDSLGGKNDVA